MNVPDPPQPVVRGGGTGIGPGVGTGVALVLLATSSVQVGAGLAQTLFASLGPGGTVWLRLVAATAVLALAGVASAWRSARQARSRGPVESASPRPPRARVWGAVALFGLVLALMNTTFYLSIDRIPLGLAVSVEFLGPLGLTLALSRRRSDVVWSVLAAAGLAALVAGPALTEGAGSTPDVLGLLLAGFAGACWAAYILCSRRVGALVPGGRGLTAAMGVATLLTLPLGVHALPRMTDPTDVLAGLAVGLLSSAIPYGAELEALRRLPARVFGVLLALDPVAAALAGLVVLGQRLHLGQWLGVALVCVAGAGATWAARTDRRPG